MIRYDRKMAKAALKLTKDYRDILALSNDRTKLELVSKSGNNIPSVRTGVPASEAAFSIKRLADRGLFSIDAYVLGDQYFRITPFLVHRFAFWFDTFSKRFIGGYVAGVISGIIITVVGGLLSTYIRLRLGI